jgi:hypothetical protein
MPGSIRPKRLYLARRHPSLTPAAFITRWREHGRLAMSFMARQQWQNVTRYAHLDAIRDSGIPGVAQDIDGVGMIGFRDLEARRRHAGFAEARAVLEPDEDGVFAARVNRSGLVADERVVFDEGRPRAALIRVLERRADVASDVFADRCRDELAPALRAALSGLRRYVQCWPLPPERGPAWGLACDLVDELWFDDRDALRAACASSGVALRGDGTSVRPTTLVAVEEVVLHPA